MKESRNISSKQILDYIDTISVVITDLGGANTKIVDCNNGAVKIFGYKKEELIGQKVSILHLSGDTMNFSSSQKKLSKDEKGFNGETILVRKGGTEFPALLTVHPFFDDNGTLIGTIGTAQDITNTKTAEDELRQHREHLEDLVNERTKELETQKASIEESSRALTYLLEDVNEARFELKNVNDQLENVNKELEAFAYSVSHDLRTPLRHIDRFINLLNKPSNQSDPEKVKKYSEVISSSAQRMGKLLDDLLTLSRIGSNEVIKQTFNVNELISEIIEEYEPSLKDRKVNFKVDKITDIKSDRNLMRVVFYNLIDNAIKFTKHKEVAEIKIGESTKYKEGTTIFIKDNGAGFDMKYVNKLFGVFQRLHLESEFEGTGIGLASVQRIIYKHGGKIWAEGETNKGATFYISL